MHITVSIWNGEPWASNGKTVNWEQAPFMAQFQGFHIHGCQSKNSNKYACYSPRLWWNDKKYWKLDPQQQRHYENVRVKHLLYDYCSDRGELHKECQIRWGIVRTIFVENINIKIGKKIITHICMHPIKEDQTRSFFITVLLVRKIYRFKAALKSKGNLVNSRVWIFSIELNSSFVTSLHTFSQSS